MEKYKNEQERVRATAPLADPMHKLDPLDSLTNKTKEEEEEEAELGKILDENGFGVDHNSDPVIAKKQ